MESLLSLYGELAIVMVAYMTVAFVIALIRKRNDIADVAWGLGFLLVTAYTFFRGGFDADRGLLVLILVAIWSLRLSTHIYLRNRAKSEDYRYKKWREEWGRWFYLRTYLQVFMLQGVLFLAVSSPAVIAAANRGQGLGLLDLLGVAVWAIGFYFEAVGDRQLARHIKNPENAGKLMTTGLWRYTRHPNYFGEVTQWWGLWIVALSAPLGWVGIVGPLVITILILKVSGIPMLERKMAEHPDFAEYARKTSVFIPLPPRP